MVLGITPNTKFVYSLKGMPDGIPFLGRVCYNKDKQSSVLS